ncbi:AVAST type 3 anti-phage nuclease/ATPase Avs3a [Steroidobacter cummioxidans]|uniref:AVAST type 3 anti-phage nuclease/ATPase Avs3a n=1 Tax=Steroidobacter cummioxidans TaxID=1803913 RepID=UPI000E31801E|nr:AVAST type 3 anti-phage nuclease/ATPase Avs3a [Steroidobacter cummioxidans]
MSNTNLVRPSRDGDQFHYLWAARRSLRLLSSQDDLVAISIEGASPQEDAGLVTGEGDEIIDIAEYFGNEQVSKARLVRYMQLKHSTLHATEPWTASGLEKTITGFARRYRELLQSLSTEALLSRIEFWFVTNRWIARGFSEAIADAQAGVSPRHPTELRKLERFTGLTGDRLAHFSKLLRMADKQDDYWDQRNILFQDVQGYLPDADVSAPLQLKELITRKALSEGEKNPVITKMDVLRALGTDESRLFPAPGLIQKIDAAIARAQETDIIEEIIKATQPVVVHASAGVGKTVFATRISAGLPEESVSVLYDCFGNGQYRNASGYRHRHKDALVQIANELAGRGLCHPLIPTTHADAAAYVRAFVNRLAQATTLLQLANPSALLCVIVDAADNSQMAAEEVGESRSFVRDLIREKMPSGVRLVFLCRSHRQSLLDPPFGTIRRELRPFDRDETAIFLRRQFADANEHDIDEFHRLSSENPRVQALALSRNLSLPETLRALGPSPTTVEDTIGNLLENAIAKLKDSVGSIERRQIDSICAGLAALRPLTPIPILSRMSGVDEGAIRSFAIDLGRPLIISGDMIQFFDEPAETWFREKFKPSPDAIVEFIASLKPLATKSPYVASVLPHLMLEAGKLTELVALALTSEALPETTPLEKRDVELQRLQFALKAALRSKRYSDATKLALKAGGETAGNDRQGKILQSNTDLASAFLETDLVQEIVSRRTFKSGWLGSHHAYDAALLSGRPELQGDARSRLRMAGEWLRNWSQLGPDERKKEQITDQDIAELTLAHLNIYGPAEGARSLAGWSPRQVAFRVGRIVAKRLIDHGRYRDVDELARASHNNLCTVLALIVELREVQRVPPAEVAHRAFRFAADRRIRLNHDHSWDDKDTIIDTVTALTEAALSHSVCTVEAAAALLSRYLPSEPPRTMSSRYSGTRLPLLRAYALRAALLKQDISLRDLGHPEFLTEMDTNKHSVSQDVRVFQENIGTLLPWHKLRAAALLGQVTKTSLHEELTRAREASKNAKTSYYDDDAHSVNEVALVWIDILQRIDADNAQAMEAFSQWRTERRRPLFTQTLTSLSRLCGLRQATRSAAIKFAQEAFSLTAGERADAESKSQGYIDAARAILTVSPEDAKAYFNEAVEIASKIGDENLSRWDAILHLADRAARIGRASPESAYNLARCAELTFAYVVRDKHFDWDATVQALCGLCPSSAIAILSRWRDRGFGWHEETLPVAIERLVADGSLDARDALALVPFRAGWTYEFLLDRALQRFETDDQRQSAALLFYRYVQFTSANRSKLAEVTSAHGITIAGLNEAIAFDESQKGDSNEQDCHQADERIGVTSEPHYNWDAVFAAGDLATSIGLSRIYSAFRNAGSPFSYDAFFQEATRRVSIGSEASFIQAVGQAPEFTLYHFRNFLEQIPIAWKGRPAITHAIASAVRAFCRRFCMDVRKSRYYEAFPFAEASSLAGMSQSALAGVVLDAIGETPDSVDSNRLFSLVGLLVLRLSEDESLEALHFGFALLTPVLEDKDGDGPWSRELLPPSDTSASLAGYIWASMAAPESVLRWEGSHTVLCLAALNRQKMLDQIVKLAVERSGAPFVDTRLKFYDLHALQWLLIGLARAAQEFPTALAPFGNQIADWTLKDQPHVLIRQFGARALTALMNCGIVPNQNELKERLAGINLSPFPSVKSKYYDRDRAEDEVESENNADEDRYSFGIDIGPYWYAPLGNIFALSQGKIERKALKVIRAEFCTSHSGRWDEDERGRRRIYVENHTHHSHGSYPRADTLQFYYAYHAMMILAGNLLASRPTHHSEFSEEDEFADWLNRHDLARTDGGWLWDRRDPAPLEHPAWRHRETDDRSGHAIATTDFDEALHSGEMLNVWGYWTTADSKREQSVHISSALVSPAKSEALLRALSTAEDVHDYAIPSVDSDMEIDDESGFSLKGWIVEGRPSNGLDDRDRWAGGVGFPPPSPAQYIVELMSLESDVNLRGWKDQEESIVMRSQVWGHYDEAIRHETTNPERGSRIQASLTLVKAILRRLDRDLIVEVQIDRRRRYQPYESSKEHDEERIPTRAKLYLVKPDGKLITV